MERSTANISYKGSVSDAIAETQRQKKLLVVYISGEDTESKHLEQSVWADDRVAVSVSKYCIFLHLVQGSIDALQFSAIYPQKSVPSITAVGYNGSKLWQHEGYISVENFVESIEKAWASLHLQETTIAFLAQALASKKPETFGSNSQITGENTSTSNTGSSSAAKVIDNLEDKPTNDSKLPAEEMMRETVEDITGENTSTSNTEASSAEAKVIDNLEGKPTTDSSAEAKVIDNLEDKPTTDSKLPAEEMKSETVENAHTNDSTLLAEEMKIETIEDNDTMSNLQTSFQSNIAVKDRGDQKNTQSSRREENVATVTTDIDTSLVCNDVDIFVMPKETNEEPSEIKTRVKEEKPKNEEVSEPVNCSTVVKSNDINLNIRMPDGASLKRKFVVTDTLRSVKQYVDENQSSGVGSYDLAIPYPRKVFTEQDMNVVLSELGFAARQALIVVPHRQAKLSPQILNPQHSTNIVDSTDGNNGGYFALLKRVLSFVNPFSYLGGTTNSSNAESAPPAPPARSNSYEYQPYRPNDALQGRLLSGSASSSRPSNQAQPNHPSGVTRRITPRPFGSNIHTLKHDEDDLQSKDGNMFWNGNSTQYGGDDKK